MALIFGNKNVSSVQHLQFRCSDPSEGFRRQVTMYSGLLRVEHSTGSGLGAIDFEFPLLGLFQQPPGTVGILPLSDPGIREFHAAIATASIANNVDASDPSVSSILRIQADLRLIGLLSHPHHEVFAVVLAGRIQGQKSQIKSISYHVTVLESLSPDVRIRPAHILVDDKWDGSYHVQRDADGNDTVGSIRQQGVPQV